MGLRKSHFELVELGALATGLARRDETGAIVFEKFHIADLGSQNLKGPLKVESGLVTGKQLYQKIGIEHTSFDITGKYDAVKCDLGQELTEHWGKYDLVANFATSEHVWDEYNCFKNIHNFAKPGSALVHAIPRENSWPGHCYWWYSHEFFFFFSSVAGYELLMTREVTKIGAGDKALYVDVAVPGEEGPQINMHAILIKVNSEDFMTREEFGSLR